MRSTTYSRGRPSRRGSTFLDTSSESRSVDAIRLTRGGDFFKIPAALKRDRRLHVGCGMSWKLRLFCLFVLALPTALMAAERDPLQSRVPKDQMDAAKAMRNPFPATPENVAAGDGLYHGKGTCFVCHGQAGLGDGPAAVGLDPSPRNFTNAAFHQARTDGELMWVLKNGSPGTAMIPMVGSVIDEKDAWLILLYERSLAQPGK